MWALQVEFLPEAIETMLLRATGTSRGAGGLRFECTMQALMAAILLGFAGLDHAGRIPRRTHQAESCESRPRVLVAKGLPWSVRRRRGHPNAWNRRVHTDLAAATRVEACA